MKNNWPIKKLGEVAEFQKGKLMPNSTVKKEGVTPYILIDDLRSNSYSHFTSSNQGTACLPSDTLLVWDGANAGTVGGGLTGFVGSTITKVSPAEEIDPEFLRIILSSKFSEFNKQVHGAAIPHLNKDFVSNLPVSISPMNVQKQIVERMDKIAEAQKLNDELIQKSDKLFQSLLHQELNPAGKNWEVKKLGETFERITTSILPTKHPNQEFNFIGLENIESNTGQIVGMKPRNGKLIKSTKTVFRKNDVLYGKLRPYLNKVCLADADGVCSTDIWVLRAKGNAILSLLLSAILRQPHIVTKSSASMAGANLPRANRDVFDKITISLPPLEIQKQIVAKLSAAQEYKKQLLAQKSLLKELFDSVLHKSMNGEYEKSH